MSNTENTKNKTLNNLLYIEVVFLFVLMKSVGIRVSRYKTLFQHLKVSFYKYCTDLKRKLIHD